MAVSSLAEPIVEFYRSAMVLNSTTPSPFREQEFDFILLLFRQAVRVPEAWFPAEVVLTPTQLHRAELEFDPVDMSSVDRPQVRMISAENRSGSVLLRIDQVLASRRWGNGFTFEDSEVAQLIEATIIRAAVNSVTVRLRALQKIEGSLRRHDGERSAETFSIDGLLFENLMMDILNEETYTTSRAPLDEDLREKTDLRIHLNGLKRRRGARIQVTQTTASNQYNEKLSRIRHLKEFVILSPLALAEALMREGVIGAKGQAPISAKHLDQLWRYFGHRPQTISECARMIKRALLSALQHANEHPRGPAASVLPPLRSLIRTYVTDEAFRTTGLLRQREASSRLKRGK